MEKLYSKDLTKSASTAATQNFLDVTEIKEDVIVLKNGSLRSVLAVSSINFDLKSSQEQEAIISQYQNFLNSVDFPVQILINSRKLDMKNYLQFLTDQEKKQPSELLRMQIAEYRDFIQQLVSISNIMDKNFYIIVPFSPIENKDSGFISNFLNQLDPKKNILEKRENFETYKDQLFQRVSQIIAGLSGIGLRIAPLKTEDLVELVFNAYNPNVYTTTRMGDLGKIELKN